MEVVTSFFDTVKERTRNPFFATLIAVWFVRNWDLIYSIFNFDKSCTLEEKKKFVFDYYHDKIWYEELLINISIAFGFMLIAYLLIIVSRLIVNVTDHNIIPRMNEKTVSKLVVNRDIHNSVKNERNNFYNQLEEEREKTIKLEEKFGKLKFEISQKDDEVSKLNFVIVQNNLDIEELKKIEIFNEELIKKNEKLDLENKSLQLDKEIADKEILQISKSIDEMTSNLNILEIQKEDREKVLEKLKIENVKLEKLDKDNKESIRQYNLTLSSLNHKVTELERLNDEKSMYIDKLKSDATIDVNDELMLKIYSQMNNDSEKDFKTLVEKFNYERFTSNDIPPIYFNLYLNLKLIVKIGEIENPNGFLGEDVNIYKISTVGFSFYKFVKNKRGRIL